MLTLDCPRERRSSGSSAVRPDQRADGHLHDEGARREHLQRQHQGRDADVTAVPFNQFPSPPQELAGAAAAATLVFRRDANFPASSKQQQLTLFIRATKPARTHSPESRQRRARRGRLLRLAPARTRRRRSSSVAAVHRWPCDLSQVQVAESIRRPRRMLTYCRPSPLDPNASLCAVPLGSPSFSATRVSCVGLLVATAKRSGSVEQRADRDLDRRGHGDEDGCLLRWSAIPRDDLGAMTVQPSGTVTLVFTDIEASTRLLREVGLEQYRGALEGHRRSVRDAFVRHGGYEVDYEGDGFFYAFASASDAVSGVTEAMASLASGVVQVRAGIHTGEPALDPPKYVGIDVHRAARIMACAHGGQAVLSASTRELPQRRGAAA